MATNLTGNPIVIDALGPEQEYLPRTTSFLVNQIAWIRGGLGDTGVIGGAILDPLNPFEDIKAEFSAPIESWTERRNYDPPLLFHGLTDYGTVGGTYYIYVTKRL